MVKVEGATHCTIGEQGMEPRGKKPSLGGLAARLVFM
jgi:hypothetical protein